MREIIMTGKTVEEAITEACKELGLEREEVSVEILEMPAKKLFKTIPATVKVTSDADMEAQKAADTMAATAAKAAAAKEAAPKADTQAKPAAKAATAPPAPKKQYVDTVTDIDLNENEKARLAVEYLREITAKMGIENITIKPLLHGEAIILKVDGPNVSSLIGRRGETMEALSYLCGLVANHIGGSYAKIGIDVGGYRSKRESDLSELAQRIAAKAIKTGRSQSLEPMNPYERRIIHSAVGEVEGVRSESTGEGAQRRVVIICTGENAVNALPERYERPMRANTNTHSQRGADRPQGSRPRSGVRQGQGGYAARGAAHSTGDDYAPKSNVPARDFATRERTDAAPVVPKRTETISDGGDMPLYGKIEL